MASEASLLSWLRALRERLLREREVAGAAGATER
jgi:hypothetical protein